MTIHRLIPARSVMGWPYTCSFRHGLALYLLVPSKSATEVTEEAGL